MSQKGTSPAYKIGFMAKEISASEATIEKASLDATKLAAQKDLKNFDAYIQKNGLRVVVQELLRQHEKGVYSKTVEHQEAR